MAVRVELTCLTLALGLVLLSQSFGATGPLGPATGVSGSSSSPNTVLP